MRQKIGGLAERLAGRGAFDRFKGEERVEEQELP